MIKAFIFSREHSSEHGPYVRSQWQVVRCMQNLLRRRRRYMSFFGHVGASASRCLSRDEMDRVNRDWATDFADGSLAVNVQRQYGNYTVCQYIIQSGRFDEGLLHYIMG